MQYGRIAILRYLNYDIAMEINRKTKAVLAFLSAEGIDCEITQEDSKTCFWSYVLTKEAMTGFISLHEHDGDMVLSASVTIAFYKPHRKEEASARLLEENMALQNGLALASQMETMVILRFSDRLELLSDARLLFLLNQLHTEAREIHQKFVLNEQLLTLLPSHWLKDGGST
ncbi:MAG: hypothetical protein ACXVA2_15900 [Mucilaginibacter sp.]